MGKLNKQQVQKAAKAIICQNPGGIRYSAVVADIIKQSPETPKNSINGWVWNLHTLFPSEISKPTRGVFVPVEGQPSGTENTENNVQTAPSGKQFKEADFYSMFADWLKDDLDEVTDVSSLGGASLKAKWGTPDVVGVYKPRASDRIKFPVEIVSAEIKIDPSASVVAFGQAVAYRLFSSKVYIAMPKTITEEDLSRLESLCMLFGIGLAIFELNSDSPTFSIRMRAQRFSPDMFFVNEFAERLSQHNTEIFEKLFG